MRFDRHYRANPDVALFLPSLEGGGAERVMATLANEFVRRSVSVDLVLVAAKGVYLSELDERVRVIDLRAPSTLRALPALVRYLRSARPRVLLSTLVHANIVAVLAQILAGRKTRVFVREADTLGTALKQLPGWRPRILRIMAKLSYAQTDGVIAVSDGVAADLRQFLAPGRPVSVVLNPIPLDDIQRLSKEAPPHAWLAPKTVPVILAVGRLEPQKDHSTLLRAFSIVREQMPCRLVVLGEGKLRPTLTAEASRLGIGDSVDFPGFVKNPFAFMRACDLFVLSSRHEGLPGVLVQALVCGIPIVSTDCPSGPREILDDGKYGTLVPPGDPARLAEAILSALASSHDRAKLIKRGDNFSPDTLVPEYLKALGLSPPA